MMLEQTACQLGDVRNWTNDGSFIPDWVRSLQFRLCAQHQNYRERSL